MKAEKEAFAAMGEVRGVKGGVRTLRLYDKFHQQSKQAAMDKLENNQKRCAAQVVTDDLGTPSLDMWGFRENLYTDCSYVNLAEVDEDIQGIQKVAQTEEEIERE